MKKSLFFVATAALVLASCSNDVKISENVALEGSNAQKEITFSPYAQMAKRAPGARRAITSGTALDNDAEIYVSAYSIPTSGTAGEYFGNVTFEKDGDTWHATSAAQYWPLSPVTLNFLGITGIPNANITWNSTKTSGANISWTHNADMYDLMYATGQGKVTQSNNALDYSDANNVVMQFKHALAQIAFKVAVGDNGYAGAIHVDKIVVNNMVNSATFTLTNSDNYDDAAPAVQSASGVWASTGTGNVDVPGSNAFASSNMSTTLADDGAVVVPCKDNATTFNSFTGFTVYFTMNGNQYTYVYEPATAADLVLSQGKKYVYNLTFTLTEILVAPNVVDWDANIDGITGDDPIDVAIP